jgi:hypothetical protein
VATLQTTAVPQGDTTGWDVEIKADLTALNADIANANATANAALTAAAAVVSNLIVPRTIVATTYTLALTDGGTALEFTNTAGCFVTIPAQATVAFPLGWQVELRQIGVGAVTVGVGVGISTPIKRMGTLVSGGDGAVLGLANRGTNSWILSGDTTG